MKISANEIHSYLLSCREHSPNLEECHTIRRGIITGQISQIIFNFGGDVIVCMLMFFEDREMYELCSTLQRAIRTHNRVNNTQIRR